MQFEFAANLSCNITLRAFVVGNRLYKETFNYEICMSRVLKTVLIPFSVHVTYKFYKYASFYLTSTQQKKNTFGALWRRFFLEISSRHLITITNGT